MTTCVVVGELRPQDYFHALNRVHDEEAQTTVECVPLPDLVKGRPVLELMARLLTERVPIAA
jgi:hypothetical protein